MMFVNAQTPRAGAFCARSLMALVVWTAASLGYSQDWGPMATISSTMGTNAGRLCMAEASRGDIGCPTYAPSVTAAGHVSVTGNLSATKFFGDGSGLTGVASSADRITSSTTSVTANSTGFISLTTAGTTTGYFTTAGLLVLPGISVTTANGISSTSGYFDSGLVVGSTADAITDVKTVTIRSNGYAGLHIHGDYSNTGGEPGGSYVLMTVDSPNGAPGAVLGQTGILGMINVANQDPQGGAYTGTLSNAFLLGSLYATGDPGWGALQLGVSRSVLMTLAKNGNIGIGITAPSATLHVSGSIANTTGILMASTNGTDSQLLPQQLYNDLMTARSSDSGAMGIVDGRTIGLSNHEFMIMKADSQANDDDGLSIVQWNSGGLSHVPFRMLGNGRLGLGGILTPSQTLDVSGTVRATNFVGSGAGLTGLTGDNLGNHTATQNLGMGTNAMVFGNVLSDKIYLYSNTYGIGMESNSLTNWAGSTFRWRVGGTSASTGSQQMYLNVTGLVVSGSISVNNDDSSTAPGFTWNGDSNTGFYWVGADQLGVTTGGGQRALFSSGGVRITGTVTTTGIIDAGSYIYGYPGDSAAAPGYTWSGDNNTGMFNAAGDIIGFSAGGADRFRVTASGISTTGNLSLHSGGAIYGDNGDTNYNATLSIFAGSGLNNGATIEMRGKDHASTPGYINMYALNDTGGTYPIINFNRRTSAGVMTRLLTLNADTTVDVPGILSAGGYETAGNINTGGNITIAGDFSTPGNISLMNGGNIYGDNADNTYSSGLYLIGGVDANTGSQISLYGIDNSNGGRIYMYATSDTTGTLLYRFHSRTTAGANTAILSLYQGGDAVLAAAMNVAVGSQGAPTYTFTSDPDTGMFRAGTDTLGFTTAGSESMRILANGSVGIGTSVPSSTLQVLQVGNGNDVDTAAGSGIFQVGPTHAGHMSIDGNEIEARSGAAASGLYLNNNLNGPVVTGGNLTVGGQVTVATMTSGRGNNVVCFTTSGGALTQTNNAAGCTVTSDATLKKDIVSFAPSLEKLLALRPVTFHWKDPKADKETQYGFLAQEVNKVMPELTYAPTKENKYWSMSTNALIPYLVKGVQELKGYVDVHNAALAAENAKLEARVGQLEASQKAMAAQMDQLRKDVQALTVKAK